VQEAVQTQLQAILSRLAPSGTASAALYGEALTLPQTDVRVEYLNGSAETTGFDDIAPLLMGFFIFFFVFLLAGVAFLRERNSGTLERLLASPVRRRQIVLGYFFGSGRVVFLQTLTIQLFVTHVLDVPLKGDFWLVTLPNLLLAAGSLSLGTLLSAFARNELQMFQFIPLVIVPQVLFCGLFSLRGAPDWVVWLSKVFPLTYAADALSNVALRGFGLSTVLPDLCMLTGYVLLFLLLNTLALKNYRRI
jgi:ABC-2 type transport system permease protein